MLMMRDGTVQQVGTPREIFTNPANTFVARFIGTPAMNLVQAKVNVPLRQFDAGDQQFAVPAHLANVLGAGHVDVLLGIRPNAFTIAGPQTQRGLGGAVTLVEHVGAESIITIRLDSARTVHDRDGGSAEEIMVTQMGYSDLSAGARVRVTADMDQAVVFAADSGQRISTDLPVAGFALH